MNHMQLEIAIARVELVPSLLSYSEVALAPRIHDLRTLGEFNDRTSNPESKLGEEQRKMEILVGLKMLKEPNGKKKKKKKKKK
jgi:hypothetical protein